MPAFWPLLRLITISLQMPGALESKSVVSAQRKYVYFAWGNALKFKAL